MFTFLTVAILILILMIILCFEEIKIDPSFDNFSVGMIMLTISEFVGLLLCYVIIHIISMCQSIETTNVYKLQPINDSTLILSSKTIQFVKHDSLISREATKLQFHDSDQFLLKEKLNDTKGGNWIPPYHSEKYIIMVPTKIRSVKCESGL